MQNEHWDVIAALVQDVARGEPTYDRLWAVLAPEVERWVGTPRFLGRVADDEDLRREIVVRTWIKLRDGVRLRELADATPAQIRAWLRRVVKNIGIDTLRGCREYARADGAWRTTEELGDEPVHDETARRLLAKQVMAALADRVLYRDAITLWLVGHDNAEVADQLALANAAEADRVIGAAKELLRRRFRSDGARRSIAA
jgi:DNA-directed RNA polymerase specialized sigma24 family protein